MRLQEWDSFETDGVKHTPFTFDLSLEVHITPDFSFADILSAPSHRRLLKRTRSKADVDGEGSGDVQKKKRRLRLELITSRLSRPFATPTSHIASRGSSRIALWAKRIASGRHALHKIAILNSLRLGGFSIHKWPGMRQAIPSQMPVEKIIEFRRNRTDSPLSSEVPRPAPKPFKASSNYGLSNYDAIDREGDPYGDVGDFEDDPKDEAPKDRKSEEVNQEDEFSMYPEYGAMDYELDMDEE